MSKPAWFLAVFTSWCLIGNAAAQERPDVKPITKDTSRVVKEIDNGEARAIKESAKVSPQMEKERDLIQDKIDFNAQWRGRRPEIKRSREARTDAVRHVLGGGFPACSDGVGDCCAGHAGPGCEDLVCCTTICNEDPFCCDEAWDDACADIAGDLCGVCGGGTGDECSGCIPVVGNTQYIGSSDGATGVDQSTCAGADDTNDMWHCWVSECIGEATISLCGASDFDTSLAVFEDGCNGAEVACNDDACPGLLSELIVDVTPGTLYAIRVAGFGGQTGNYTLDITCEEPIDGCIDGEGDCCAAHGNGGCDDPECCQIVCTQDAFCCDGEWDEACSDLAGEVCVACGGTIPECVGTTGDCCIENGTAGCEDGGCCATICEADPFCCETTWDGICADAAEIDCPICFPPEACLTGSGDCCVAQDGPGCGGIECCDIVCGIDPFCCDEVWDESCADLAVSSCSCNDFCEQATEIFDGATPFTNVGAATDGPAEPDCNGAAADVLQDVWFDYTSSCTGTVIVDTCGTGFDTAIAAYEGCECPVIQPALGCDDDDCETGGLQSQIEFDVVEGNCYKIRVGAFAADVTDAGTINIFCDADIPACIDGSGDCCTGHGGVGCESPGCCDLVCTQDAFCCDGEWDEACADLAGDECFECGGGNGDFCEGCLPVVANVPFAGSTVGASGVDESSCAGGDDDADIWHCWTSECAGQATISLCDGSDFDTSLAVYDASGGCGGAELACNDDACPGLLSELTMPVAFGNEYLIRVAGFGGQTGNYNLNIDCTVLNETCIDADGDCLSGNGSPGCDSTACCAEICSLDPFCCDEVWDDSCADLALVTFACNSNDACEDSFEILDGATDFSNVGASTDGPLELGCDGAADDVENDVWYDYTATCTGVLTADTCGTAFDTALAVYDGCECPAVAPGLGCDDDACDTGLQSLVIVDGVVEGNCYKVRVGSFSAAADGEGVVNINCEPYIEECIDGVGDCCEAHGNGGCDDTECCNLVCEQDAFCCEGEWDEACADLSGQVCTACGGTIPECVGTGGDCCEANGTPGCDNGSCCADICTADPFCCATTWDQICADNANIACAVCIAPEICFESSDPCLEPHDLPACEIPACCGEVCNEDTFCCDVEWDEACVDIASDIASCQGGGGNENDNCADAEPVTAGTTFYDSTGMTDDGPELPEECDEGFGLGFGSDLWYAYTAGDCGAVTLSLCEDTAYDSRMAVYEGCGCPTSNDALAGCDDDGCGTTGGPSSITLDAVAGTCYLVRIGGFNGAAGTGALQVTEDFTGCSACPDGDVTWMTPVDGVVDARQPHPVGSLEPQQGIDTFDVAAPSGAAEECWSMCETSDGGLGANSIVSAIDNGDDTYTLTLSRPITPGQVTTITYNEAVTGTFTSHPSNVNGDGAAGPLDILAIIDYLNAVDVSPFGTFSEDIDQSGLLTPTDILAVIDLLNGADTHDVWNNTDVPENTTCP
jgi:hypothetical protein